MVVRFRDTKEIFGLVTAICLILTSLAFLNPNKVLADTSFERGKSLVRQHCSRCHVIPGLNPYGGIGSTPSFSAMKWLDDWRRRFEIFYTLPPHPALVRIRDVSDPRDAFLPAFSSEIFMSLEDIDDILAFVDTIKPPR
jgi:mono/diheme cytochrome c family protein